VVDERSVVLIRLTSVGSVFCEAAGAPLQPGETPGMAARRAATQHFGVDVEVGELLYADTDRGAEHYFFLARPIGGIAHIAGEHAATLRMASRLAYRVEPRELARRLTRRGRAASR
jgi:hypothetical protein